MGEIARNNSLSFFPLPNAWRYGAALAAATALIVAPGLAAAQDCDAVQQERALLAVQMLKLLNEAPGAGVIINLCMGSAEDQYRRTNDANAATANFGVCALIGCSLGGDSKCTTVMPDWFRLKIRDEALAKQQVALRCEQ